MERRLQGSLGTLDQMQQFPLLVENVKDNCSRIVEDMKRNLVSKIDT